MGVSRDLRRAGHHIAALHSKEPGKQFHFPTSRDTYEVQANGSYRKIGKTPRKEVNGKPIGSIIP